MNTPNFAGAVEELNLNWDSLSEFSYEMIKLISVNGYEPTSEEIEQLAKELGVPVDRLLKTREDVEKELEQTKLELRNAKVQASRYQEQLKDLTSKGAFDRVDELEFESWDRRFLTRRIRQMRYELDRFHRGERTAAMDWEIYSKMFGNKLRAEEKYQALDKAYSELLEYIQKAPRRPFGV